MNKKEYEYRQILAKIILKKKRLEIEQNVLFATLLTAKEDLNSTTEINDYGIEIKDDLKVFIADLEIEEASFINQKLKRFERLEDFYGKKADEAKELAPMVIDYDKKELKKLTKMADKLKWIITALQVIMTAPDIIAALISHGEDLKFNTEDSEEYKKLQASISATLKVYVDRGELERCKISDSNLFYYGLPSYFHDGQPFSEYMPKIK